MLTTVEKEIMALNPSVFLARYWALTATNNHQEAGLMLVTRYGTDSEKMDFNTIASRYRKYDGKLDDRDRQDRDVIVSKCRKRMKEAD